MDTPLGELPAWPKPNYIDPVRRTWLPTFMIIWLAASTIMLAGRFYLRARKLAGGLGLDDIFIALAWLFSIVLTYFTWMGVAHYGFDRHTWDVKPEWAVGLAFTLWIAQVFFVFSMLCLKLSVLLFFRRTIKDTVDRRWVWALRCAIGITVCYSLGVVLAYMLQCRPLDAFWKAFGGNYHKSYTCNDFTKIAVVTGVLNVFSDLIIVILPCIMLNQYHLRISRQRNILLNLTFAAGFVTTGAGIARSYYCWQLKRTIDTTWLTYDVFVWSIIECQLAIICACAPHLRAFVRRYTATAPHNRGDDDNDDDGTFGSGKTSAHTWTSLVDGNPRDPRRERDRLESDVLMLSLAPPPPAVVGNWRDRGLRGAESGVGVECEWTDPPSPVMESAEEYERYVHYRLNCHGLVVRDRLSRPGGVDVVATRHVRSPALDGRVNHIRYKEY